jgi:hypothetical protein
LALLRAGIDPRSYPVAFILSSLTRVRGTGREYNGINEHTCGPRARVDASDVCDARRRAGGLTRVCIREGMLNRCAAAPARAYDLPATITRACVCTHVATACRPAERFTYYYYPSSESGTFASASLDPLWRFLRRDRKRAPARGTKDPEMSVSKRRERERERERYS